MKLLPAPGSAERQRLTWLVGLVVVLLGVWFWMARPAEPVTAASKIVAPEERGSTAPLPMPEALKLTSLEDVPVLEDANRNPFAYGVRPPPPAPPIRTLPPVALPPSGSVLPPAPQGPPPIGLKLAGITVPTPGGGTLVTLKDPTTNAIYLAREGEVLDGRYRVVKIGVESVVVSYVDGTGMRTIPLGG